MGFLGFLLDKSKDASTSITVKGNLMEVRDFIVKKCKEKGHGFGQNKEDAWLYAGAVKNGKDDQNEINASNFHYTRTLRNGLTGKTGTVNCMYTFSGRSTANGFVTLTIAITVDHAQSRLDTIVASITNKFEQA